MCESNSTVIDNFDVKLFDGNCLTLKTWWKDMPSVPRSCGGKKIIDWSNLDIYIELVDKKMLNATIDRDILLNFR